ncbi:MAG: YIP1 family protein [Candidatus Altiarchaeota archaeon]
MRSIPPIYENKNPEPINYSFSERFWGVLKFQIFVLQDVAECKPWLQIATIIVVSVLLQSILGMGAKILMSMPLIGPDISDYYGVILIGFLTGTSLSLIFAAVTVVFSGLVNHLFIKVFGGGGSYKETLSLYGYIQLWVIPQTILVTPLTVLGIRYAPEAVVIVVSFIILAEMALAVSKVHKISIVRAFVAVFASTLLIGAVMVWAANLASQMLGEEAVLKFSKTML